MQFAVLEIVWLAELLRQQQQQPAAGSNGSSVFSSIPESVLSDAASWLTFVIQMREAEQLAAVDIGKWFCYLIVTFCLFGCCAVEVGQSSCRNARLRWYVMQMPATHFQLHRP